MHVWYSYLQKWGKKTFQIDELPWKIPSSVDKEQVQTLLSKLTLYWDPQPGLQLQNVLLRNFNKLHFFPKEQHVCESNEMLAYFTVIYKTIVIILG